MRFATPYIDVVDELLICPSGVSRPIVVLTQIRRCLRVAWFFSRRISAMPSSCRISFLIPRGLVVEAEMFLNAESVLTVRAERSFALCPLCAAPSRRVPSRYVRRASDLPCSGHRLRLCTGGR
jgi:hypothetical protein